MREGRITIHRRGGPKFDMLRAYRILINGQQVGKLRRGGSLTLIHPEGRAVIEARIDWCSATPLAVMVGPETNTVIEVANSNGMAGAMMASDVLDPTNYLTLTLISGGEAPAGPWG